MINLVEERTKLYKDCALNAKKANVMDKAREYLNTFKLLTSYIEMLKRGEELPIDPKKLPPVPTFKEETEQVSKPTEQPKPTPTKTPSSTTPTKTPSNTPTKTPLEKPTLVKKPQPTKKPLAKKTIKKIVRKKVKKKVVNHKKQELLEQKKKMEQEEKKRIQSFEKFIEEFSNQMRNCLQKAKVKFNKKKKIKINKKKIKIKMKKLKIKNFYLFRISETSTKSKQPIIIDNTRQIKNIYKRFSKQKKEKETHYQNSITSKNKLKTKK